LTTQRIIIYETSIFILFLGLLGFLGQIERKALTMSIRLNGVAPKNLTFSFRFLVADPEP
jgi:hypothetical protein